MSRFYQNLDRVYRFLASRELTLILFIVLCVIIAPRTFAETEEIHLGIPGRVVFGVMALNLLLCTVQRWKALSKPVIVLHLGTIVVIAGAVISTFGYVATVNIYEGSSTAQAFRWDIMKDSTLGYDIAVKKINIEYYPIPVRVGIKRGEEKVGLFELKTGEEFSLDGYSVRPDTMVFPGENLVLSVFSGDELIGTAETAGGGGLPADFPYTFVLVAYQNPSFKRVWVDLSISRDSQVVAEGTSEVNSPLTWEKHSFYNTNVDADQYGIRYAGIQVTNDPGKPFVYLGFAVIGIGCMVYVFRRGTGRR